MYKTKSLTRFTFMDNPVGVKSASKNTSTQAANNSTNNAALQGIKSLQANIAYLAELTQTANTILPQGGVWQVTSFYNGVLCVSTPSHTLANHLRYMYLPYIRQLKQYTAFNTIKRLKVIVTPLPEPKLVSHPHKLVMTEFARSICDEIALTLNQRQNT